ncbi:MAG: hypothetical protein HKN50_00525 [Gammaproteobacteria bacterium]|nr:hypothetical protein [Gammaproteobacteria bacterium]
MNYPPDVWFDIETLINVAQPESILLLGDASQGFLENYLAQKALINQSCVIRHIGVADVAQVMALQQRFDVTIALNLLEHLDRATGAQVLAQVRDVVGPQFCVCLPINGDHDASWQITDMFAFALRKVALYKHDDIEFGLFKYNIDEYKKTPDWLNSDNWANPEMWGKYWW